MTDDREPRMRRLEDAIEAFLDHDQTKSGEELLANNEELADLIRPMLEQPVLDPQDLAAAETLVVGAQSAATGERSQASGKIGDLEIVREIGRGGMGIVYEAIDRLLKRRVAVKLMLRPADMSASSIVRFRREAELAASLSHPSIVPVHALGETGDEFYLSMGLVASASLADVLSLLRRSLEPSGDELPRDLSQVDFGDVVEQAVQVRFADAPTDSQKYESHERSVAEILCQIGDALAHAHDNGIIHRDVKPANVLVDGAGKAFLTDFGLACVQDDPRVTQAGASPGTPQYMAPEQINDERGALGPATDVFALGVTLYESLTLHRAFPGDTLPAVLFAVTTRDPIDPLTHNPTISPDLVAIMHRALRKNPGDRYPTAREFAADLSAFLRGEAVSVRPLPWSSRMARQAKREPWQVAVVLLLAIGIPLVVALWMSSDNNEPQSKVGEQVLLGLWVDRTLSDGFREAGEGDLVAARACFDAILAKDPTSEAGIAGMSVLARKQGDGEALAVLDEYPVAVADSTALLRRRATLLKRLGHDSAEQAARGLPAEFVDFDAFLAGYALLELGHEGKQEEYVAARRMLHRACVTADRPRPVYYYEWLHAAAHDHDQEDAESAIAAIQRLWPQDATGQFWVSFAHTLFGKRDEAIEALRRALKEDPSFEQAALNLAALLRRSGRADEALRVMRETLPGAARAADVLCEIGKLLVLQRNLPQALAEMRAAIDVYPDHLGLRANYASTLILSNQLEEAEKQVLFVLRVQPDNTEARCSLATLQLRRGDAKSARKSMEMVVKIKPTARAYYELGVVCVALLDGLAAKAAYENCIRLDETHAKAMVNLANMHVRVRDLKTAEGLLRRAVAVEPTLVPARRTLLRVLDAKPAQAVAMCRDWVKHMPQSPEPLRYLASSMARTKDPELMPEALQVAAAANELAKGADGPTMHVLSVVELWSGDAAKAKATAVKAMMLLDPKDRFSSFYRKQMTQTLALCEQALKSQEGK
ncbi:MAG: serine/threonine protein kinase/tetratricopeptide (TPR) repeat protein [Planctomycetota bacterium]|jgi:serine/threonine protein kinase/tetratricopeptide (TPR) repeat protein